MLAISLFVSSLEARDDLDGRERELLAALPAREKLFARGETIVASHSEPSESCLVQEGLAGREIYLEDGSRQITAIHVPGDFVDLHSLLLKKMDHGVVALTDCRVAFVAHGPLRRLVEEAPHLGRLLWLTTIIDAAIQRQWTASMGRRDAVRQLAHLICELHARLTVVGLADGNRMSVPISQAVLADVLGLSSVHVNRTIRALKATGCVSWERSEIAILKPEGLRELCEFDATYLNLIKRPR